MYYLLIATVGGSPEPVAASILHWRPDRILFVPSVDTAKGIGDIRKLLDKNEYNLDEGRYDIVALSDPQDFSRCVREMRSGLVSRVAEWLGKGGEYECVVDFTGGTKCMSAAVALVARPWSASYFSYVGGEKRDGADVGVVVSGSEHVAHTVNPWDAFGYQVVEDAVTAFDCHAFGEGVRMLRNTMKRILGDSLRKTELNSLATFMNAYDLWSRSEYGKAFNEFKMCEIHVNDLVQVLSPVPRSRIQEYIDRAKDRLKPLKEGSDHPTQALLEDLISDAERRRQEGRHVDAVARLYRAVEATAQLRLWDEYKILSGKVEMDKLPESIRKRMEKQSKDGTVKLALQDAYEFLIQKQDELGKCFESLGWNNQNSPLSKRNDSISGHGFVPVSSNISDELWKGTLKLAGLSEDQVFRFPRLGKRDGVR